MFRDTNDKEPSLTPDSLSDINRDFSLPLEHWHEFELALGLRGLDGSEGTVRLSHLSRPNLTSISEEAARGPGAFWPEMDPHFLAKEAVGIYVENGTAAFRRLWLENKVHAIS